MTITWDTALIEELSGRRVIPFLGAGATMSCERKLDGRTVARTPSWPSLIQMLADSANCSVADVAHIRSLVEKERYLDAAEIIRTGLTSQEYSRILTREFSNIETGDLHSSIIRLDQRIVMTTNYDSAYEDLCTRGAARDGYTMLNYYDAGLVNRLRSPTRLILKLHGSVRHPEMTVLTRSDYFKARTRNPRFFGLVQSLFATNTLLFIGYSLSDPDVQLLLETSNIGGEDSFRHYAVVPEGSHEAVSRAISESYGINLIQYDASHGHAVVTESLVRLADLVEAERGPAS